MEDSREVSKERAKKYMDDFGFNLFMETSAKTGYNTKELFVEAAKLLYDEYVALNQSSKNTQKLRIKRKVINQSNKKKCCK